MSEVEVKPVLKRLIKKQHGLDGLRLVLSLFSSKLFTQSRYSGVLSLLEASRDNFRKDMDDCLAAFSTIFAQANMIEGLSFQLIDVQRAKLLKLGYLFLLINRSECY